MEMTEKFMRIIHTLELSKRSRKIRKLTRVDDMEHACDNRQLIEITSAR